MSVLLAALLGRAVLTQPSTEAAMQTLLKAAVTLRTFDHFAAACTRGTYRIDGFVLPITYGDAATARHRLITNPDDAKAASWIDGHGYAGRGE